MSSSKKNKTPGLIAILFMAAIFLVFAVMDFNSNTVCVDGGRNCVFAELIASILGVGLNTGKAVFDVAVSVLMVKLALWHYQGVA